MSYETPKVEWYGKLADLTRDRKKPKKPKEPKLPYFGADIANVEDDDLLEFGDEAEGRS